MAEALKALAKAKPEAAVKKAKELESDQSKKLIYAIADLYSENGSDDNHDYFIRVRKNFNGFELLGYGSIYGKYLKKCTRPETAIKAAEELSKMAISDNQFVKYTALKIFKNSLTDVLLL